MSAHPSNPTDQAAPALGHALVAARAVNCAVGEVIVGHVGHCRDWDALQPHWNALLDQTPGRTVFQTFEYLRVWWEHLGQEGELFIVVALKDDVPLAIAPLQITRNRWLRSVARTISYIGQPSEADRPRLLAQDQALGAALVTNHVLQQQARWDALVLFEQQPDDALVCALRERLDNRGCLVALVEGHVCPWVDITGSWGEYLSTRSRAFRKGLKRRRAELEKQGELRLEVIDGGQAQAALARFRLIEANSWKPRVKQGTARSPRHAAFYHALSATPEVRALLRFAFLQLNGSAIAATFGLLWQRRLYSLHIAHDERYADSSPGVVLTALELERAFQEHRYDQYDFLGGFLTNKLSWSTGAAPTIALFVNRRDLHGYLFHLTYFKIKPRLVALGTRLGVLDRLRRWRRAFNRRRRPVDPESGTT